MRGKATKLTVREEFPTASSSKRYRAHVDAIAFNTDFIAKRDPLLAVVTGASQKSHATQRKQLSSVA